MLINCRNCKREFYAPVEGAYCEECWKAWSKNDGTFEAREVTWLEWFHETDQEWKEPQ